MGRNRGRKKGAARPVTAQTGAQHVSGNGSGHGVKKQQSSSVVDGGSGFAPPLVTKQASKKDGWQRPTEQQQQPVPSKKRKQGTAAGGDGSDGAAQAGQRVKSSPLERSAKRARGTESADAHAGAGGAGAAASAKGEEDTAFSDRYDISSEFPDADELLVTDDQRARLAELDGRRICDQGGVDSRVRAEKVFAWLIAPMTVNEFEERYFEKRPLIIRRGLPKYYDWLRYRIANVREWTEANDGQLQYGRHVDVARVVNGVRETLNEEDDEGQGATIRTKELWRRFDKDGCSIRSLHPQQYHAPLRDLMSVLEDYWQCSTGINTYLTPRNSQGFAPHFDDVCAFVCQTDGAKHWRLHPARDDAGRLPRFSSPNFKTEELGPPIWEGVLEEGDMLYMPRGQIHQGDVTPNNPHSLHVTISTGLYDSWYDLMKFAIPVALETAMTEDSTFRESLPRHVKGYMGVMHSDSEDPRRNVVANRFAELMGKLLEHMPLDAAVDHMAVTHIRARLPPHAPDANLPSELPRPEGDGDRRVNRSSLVRPITASAMRLVVEADTAVVYSPVQNPAEQSNTQTLDEIEAQGEIAEDDDTATLCVEFDIELAEAIEAIISAYPQYTSVEHLPGNTDVTLDCVRVLYEQGVLQVKGAH